MATALDDHGQPLISGYNANRRVNRALNELAGLLRGVVADNYINEPECESLAAWVLTHREVSDNWPVNVLIKRLNRIYEDKIATEEEREDLKLLVQEIIGKQDDETLEFGPTDLPLTKPAPDVVFDRNEFVFTGRFLYGTRKQCEKEVELRGGRAGANVRLQTSYLVIGSLTSRDWKYTTHGLKIEKAIQYTQRCPIALVSEKHWQSFLLKA